MVIGTNNFCPISIKPLAWIAGQGESPQYLALEIFKVASAKKQYHE